MGRSQTPDLDRLEREERRETVRDERSRRLTREEIEETALQMSTAVGRRSVARRLEAVEESPWSPNNAEMARRVGHLEDAQELMRVVKRHCPKEWLLLEQERIARESAWHTEQEYADE